MRVVAMSDLHGRVPRSIPACDLLLIAGDVCPDARGSGFYNRRQLVAPVQAAWLEGTLAPWLAAQPARATVLCWGNHDYVGEFPELIPPMPATVLTDRSAEVAGVRIYATPWTTFAPWMWAFDEESATVDAAMRRIPHDVEVLVTHGPPFGVLDLTIGGDRAGSRALAAVIPQLSALRLHVFGHIHEARGSQGVHHNVSLLDASYRPHRLPVAQIKVN